MGGSNVDLCPGTDNAVLVILSALRAHSFCLTLIVNLAGTADIKCAKKLNDEEPFDRFFGEVFRHHSGQGTPGDGEGGFITLTHARAYVRTYAHTQHTTHIFETFLAPDLLLIIVVLPLLSLTPHQRQHVSCSKMYPDLRQ